MTLPLRNRLSLCLLLALCACTPDTHHLGTFRSSAGYTALYPFEWHQLEPTDDYLDLLSTDQHVEAIVIAADEANLTVHDVRADDNVTLLTLDAALAHDIGDSTLLSRADIAMPRTPRGCSRVVEQRTRGPLIPGDDLADSTSFFCVLGPRVVEVAILNWQDDPKEAAYVATALNVVKSVRAN